MVGLNTNEHAATRARATRAQSIEPHATYAGTDDEPRFIREARKIAAEWQAAKIDGVLIDANTADRMVKVYEALSASNQERVEGVGLARFAAFVWKV
jgi:hypothetical protein